jgi:histidyl-tRNA synthetase
MFYGRIAITRQIHMEDGNATCTDLHGVYKGHKACYCVCRRITMLSVQLRTAVNRVLLSRHALPVSVITRCNSTIIPPSNVSTEAVPSPRKSGPPPALVRGMHDIFGEEMAAKRHILKSFQDVTALYGFEEVETPIIEQTRLFARSLGDQSDVVSKEMYTFCPPNSDESLTLRPENSAGIIRSLITAQTIRQQHRISYAGPMFRHERPQKGRFRQFWQVGVEAIGSAAPETDVETIACAHVLLKRVCNVDVKLLLNSLGTPETIQQYSQLLKKYFEGHTARLSVDSQNRLKRGATLRILDSKDPGDKEVVATAPHISETFDVESASHFTAVQRGLTSLHIPFEIDARLVRGLDYYRHTIFEFVAVDTPTARSSPVGTLLAGGRYDGLAETLGGPAGIPAIGWAAGLERLQLHSTQPQASAYAHLVAVVPLIEKGSEENNRNILNASLCLAAAAREAGSPCVSLYGFSSVAKGLAAANKHRAALAVLIGEKEVRGGEVAVKNLQSGVQSNVPMGQAAAHITQELQQHFKDGRLTGV